MTKTKAHLIEPDKLAWLPNEYWPKSTHAFGGNDSEFESPYKIGDIVEIDCEYCAGYGGDPVDDTMCIECSATGQQSYEITGPIELVNTMDIHNRIVMKYADGAGWDALEAVTDKYPRFCVSKAERIHK